MSLKPTHIPQGSPGASGYYQSSHTVDPKLHQPYGQGVVYVPSWSRAALQPGWSPSPGLMRLEIRCDWTVDQMPQLDGPYWSPAPVGTPVPAPGVVPSAQGTAMPYVTITGHRSNTNMITASSSLDASFVRCDYLDQGYYKIPEEPEPKKRGGGGFPKFWRRKNR